MKVLVTGANGFVGSALFKKLKTLNHVMPIGTVRCDLDSPKNLKAVLENKHPEDKPTDFFVVDSLSSVTDWQAALQGVQIVVHTAARVHVMQEKATDPLTVFRQVNVEGTLNLARQAADQGVRRFIFLSSIKVNGESTQPGFAFSPEDTPCPADAYAVSKMEAEFGLQKVAVETGMEVVIIRLPLVYGPGVKANFLSMMRWVSRGLPLPLGAIHNRRSLVSLDNLISLIVCCLNHPAAANQVFLVSDDHDVSVTQLLRYLGEALNKPARLIPMPVFLLMAASILLRRSEVARRLCGSLQIDISKTKKMLGWKPVMTVKEGLRQTAESFLYETHS